MSKEEIKEAKLIGIAMAKIREVCQSHEDCTSCPLSVPTKQGHAICRCSEISPREWDVDEALIVIGYRAGKEKA